MMEDRIGVWIFVGSYPQPNVFIFEPKRLILTYLRSSTVVFPHEVNEQTSGRRLLAVSHLCYCDRWPVISLQETCSPEVRSNN